MTAAMPATHAHRSRPTERANRVALTVTGLALVAAGSYVLFRSFGVYGDDRAHDLLLSDGTRRWVSDRSTWFWPVAAATAALVALLALRWLLAQLRTDRPGNVDVVWTGESGSTRIQAGAMASAVADEVAHLPGVEDADARLVSATDHPELHLYVDVTDGSDLAALTNQIEAGAVVHLREALELSDTRVHVRYRLAEPAGRTLK